LEVGQRKKVPTYHRVTSFGFSGFDPAVPASVTSFDEASVLSQLIFSFLVVIRRIKLLSCQLQVDIDRKPLLDVPPCL
jgi:hypothetical protein